MREKQVLGKEILYEFIERIIRCTKTVSGRDARDAGDLMHVLCFNQQKAVSDFVRISAYHQRPAAGE
jgi:hypothetical protein